MTHHLDAGAWPPLFPVIPPHAEHVPHHTDGTVRVVIVADTHGRHAGLALPPGDVLIHAGDLTPEGRHGEVQDVLEWLGDQTQYGWRVMIAGNHDWLFERERGVARAMVPPGVTYLEDSGATVAGLRVYGTPWTPAFHHWAFMRAGGRLRAVWAGIPDGTDVLVTHGPPRGVLDTTRRGEHSGDADLLTRVGELAPRLHVFGHIHDSRGHGYSRWHGRDGRTLFANAAICDADYDPRHPAYVVDIPARGEATVVAGTSTPDVPAWRTLEPA